MLFSDVSVNKVWHPEFWPLSIRFPFALIQFLNPLTRIYSLWRFSTLDNYVQNCKNCRTKLLGGDVGGSEKYTTVCVCVCVYVRMYVYPGSPRSQPLNIALFPHLAIFYCTQPSLFGTTTISNRENVWCLCLSFLGPEFKDNKMNNNYIIIIIIIIIIIQ